MAQLEQRGVCEYVKHSVRIDMGDAACSRIDKKKKNLHVYFLNVFVQDSPTTKKKHIQVR